LAYIIYREIYEPYSFNRRKGLGNVGHRERGFIIILRRGVGYFKLWGLFGARRANIQGGEFPIRGLSDLPRGGNLGGPKFFFSWGFLHRSSCLRERIGGLKKRGERALGNLLGTHEVWGV